jgi:uncharacterized protein YecT (DUF1311 family)
MRTGTLRVFAVLVAGALFAGASPLAHSQSTGGSTQQEQQLVPRGNEKPSFDCAKAKTASARLICADAELARLDGELGVAFQKRKAEISAPDQSKFVAEQVAWIRDRNIRCGLDGKNSAAIEMLAKSKQCVASAIQERIAFLAQTENAAGTVPAQMQQRTPTAPVQQDAYPRCDGPPYGMTEAAYKAFVKAFGDGVPEDIDPVLQAKCKALQDAGPDVQESWTKITSLYDYANHIKHQWVKYGEGQRAGRHDTSYIDLASIVRTGDTLTVLDLQDWNPSINFGMTGEYIGSNLNLVRYDCGSIPRSMILASLDLHGHMGSGTKQGDGTYIAVPQMPQAGWYVIPSSNKDGTASEWLKARDMACNAVLDTVTPPAQLPSSSTQTNAGQRMTAPLAVAAQQVRLPTPESGNYEQFCTEEWTKRGVLDSRMFDACMRDQAEGDKTLARLAAKYSSLPWMQQVIDEAIEHWTKRGMRNEQIVAFVVSQQIDAYLDIVYLSEHDGFHSDAMAGCSAKWTKQAPNWGMIIYCYKQATGTD